MSKFTVPDKVLYVCTGSKCGKKGGKEMYKLVKAYTKHLAAWQKYRGNTH